ncbi:MAG TPA: DUF2848 domain-containing protein [Beijerinckiaceae bacterium]|nr:DUF2848 domain-containing protein [Beijerinckiaceae bacterium]
MTEIRMRTPSGERRVAVTSLVIAGWTGRDKAAMEHHIAELEALGVARPARTPIFYRASATRLTQAPAIEVVGTDSSGEVEYVLVAAEGRLYVGVGSDHTDRKVETYGVTVSKQMCDKPLGTEFWPFEDVAGHWDRLHLRSFATIGGERAPYQDGPVARMLAPLDLVRDYTGSERLPDGTVMFCGTLGAIGGIRPAERFEGELADPVLGRRIAFGYDVRPLPIEG